MGSIVNQIAPFSFTNAIEDDMDNLEMFIRLATHLDDSSLQQNTGIDLCPVENRTHSYGIA